MSNHNTAHNPHFKLSQNWSPLPELVLEDLDLILTGQKSAPKLIILSLPVLHSIQETQIYWPKKPKLLIQLEKMLRLSILPKLVDLIREFETSVVIYLCEMLDFKSSSAYLWPENVNRVIYGKNFNSTGPLFHFYEIRLRNHWIDYMNEKVKNKVRQSKLNDSTVNQKLILVEANLETVKSPIYNTTFLLDSVHLLWRRSGNLLAPVPMLTNLNLALNSLCNKFDTSGQDFCCQ